MYLLQYQRLRWFWLARVDGLAGINAVPECAMEYGRSQRDPRRKGDSCRNLFLRYALGGCRQCDQLRGRVAKQSRVSPMPYSRTSPVTWVPQCLVILPYSFARLDSGSCVHPEFIVPRRSNPG